MSAPGLTAGGLTPGEFSRVRELFGQACQLPVDERLGFIELHTADQAGVRLAVMELMVALEDAPRTGEAMPAGMIAIECEPGRDLPETIGPYQIAGVIGEGGMGIVYLARQANPQRDVAIKIVRLGHFSRQLHARFAREIRVLGRLEHPGITRIYEAGTARNDNGEVAYFAMEYVQGPPLDRAVAEFNLSIAARVEIVARIADAVQHAHTKGIIHRDLKPGNILLAGRNSSGDPSRTSSSELQPKILDFGVARLMDPDTQHTAVTETGLVIGTIGYMSPEQLSGDSTEIDARADVYAIGVILYELLTGRLPHDVRGKPLPEAARIVRDEPPALFAPAGGGPKIDDDLQTITLRAIERERERRYPTAAALADDLRRYLQNQPILARPPSTMYQLSKFVRRHKSLVAAVTTGAMAVVAGLVISTVMFVKEQHARKRADANDRLSSAVRGYMIDGLLMAASPSRKGYDVKMLDVLEDASRGLHEQFANDPEVEASIRTDLGNVLAQIGRYDKAKAEYQAAIQLLEQTRGKDDVQTNNALTGLATVLQQLHDDQAWLNVARDALERAERALPDNDPQRLLAMGQVGGALVTLRRYDEARAILERGIAIAEAQPKQPREALGMMLNWLATCERFSGAKEGEVKARRKTLDFTTTVYGPEHPYTLASRNNLAGALLGVGDVNGAIDVARGNVEAIEKLYPPGHPTRADAYNMMGYLLHANHQYQPAERYLKLAYEASAEAVKDFDWTTEQRIHSLQTLYATWPGHAQELHEWCIQSIKARMMLAHVEELQNLPDVLKSAVDRCATVGRAESPASLLDAVWNARDTLAPPGHGRRAAFYANFVRAAVNAQHTDHAAEALALADASLAYAIESDVAKALVADAHNTLK